MHYGNKFNFGTYKTPKVRIGDVITCLFRDCDVIVVGLSAGRIQWPLGQRPGKGAKTFVVYGDLERAIRKESLRSVCYWFGVTSQTVTLWRAALGVPRCNEGTVRLLSQNFKTPWGREIIAKAHAKLKDPERCEKIRLSKLGKKRPRELIEKLRLHNLGKKHTLETRRKLSIAQKRRGVIPPAAGVPWTEAEMEILLNYPRHEVAILTGRTLKAVDNARAVVSKKYPDKAFKIPLKVAKRWSSAEILLFQKHGTAYVARKTGRSLVAVVAMRDKLRRESNR